MSAEGPHAWGHYYLASQLKIHSRDLQAFNVSSKIL
jgi:hypothetical protein